MRALFLDFDGVISSDAHKRTVRIDGRIRRVSDLIDRAAIALLNQVVERTGAAVVISSNWRKTITLSSLRRLLRVAGFRGEVVGKTPVLRRDQLEVTATFGPAHGSSCGPLALTHEERLTLRHVERGHEIQRWLSEHPEVTSFAILDDDTDMAHLYDRMVLTDCADGLQAEHVERLVVLLTGAA